MKWLQVLLFNTNNSIQHYSFICTVKWFQVLLCITNNSIKHKSFVYKKLNVQTVLFLAIQFSMSLVCTQFKCQTVLFDPKIRPYQVLPLWVRLDLGAMAMKGYSTFPKAPTLLEPHHQIVLDMTLNNHWGGVLTPSAEMQLVYSIAPPPD